MARCRLYDRECIDCCECDEYCDIYDKKCDNCYKCLNTDADFAGIIVDSIITGEDEKTSKLP